MTNFVLVMFLIAMSSNAAADWVPIGADAPGADKSVNINYVDRDTIRKAGSKVKMWELMSGPATKKFNEYSFKSIKARSEYDCDDPQTRQIELSAHSGEMGDGVLVYIEREQSYWKPVAPGTLGERLWQVACGKRKL